MSTKTVYIQMGEFKQTIESARVHKTPSGDVMVVSPDGKIYETHISNVVIVSDAMKNPEKVSKPKQEWRIVMVSEGGTKHHFMGGYKSEEDANAAAESYNWRYVDENRFEWRLEVEEE